MRIAYADPHCVPDSCTESLQILQTVDALGEIGVHVDLITPKPRGKIVPADVLGRDLSPNVTLHPLPDYRKRWWFPSASNRPFYFLAKRAVPKIAVDALLARNLKTAECFLRGRDGPPVFYIAHEVFAQSFREDHPKPNRAERRKLAALERRESLVCNRAAGVIALSRPILDDLRAMYDTRAPAAVIPNGVDLRMAERARARRTSPLPVLLYLGSLHPWKGVDLLIEAMKEIPNAVLRIAGGTDERIGELEREAERAGVADRVAFLGPIPPLRRFEVIGSADICLLPMTNTSMGGRYTSPLKLFEYMAMGKAIVAADVPSSRETLEHERNALLVEVGNARSLADAVHRLLRNADLRERLGRAARESAEDRSWEARARAIVAFIRRQGNAHA